MALYTNFQNPQKIVVSGRDANGQLVEMAELTVTFDNTSGKDVATVVLTAKPDMTVSGLTITQP